MNLILGDVADDYEEFHHILKNVTQEAAERGISLVRKQVFDELEDLVSQGYILAYVYLPQQNVFAVTADYSPERIDDLWFYITPKGLQVFEPQFDEDGLPRRVVDPD